MSATKPRNYADLFSLEGKNILITGGLGILGHEHVRGWCAHGAKVAIVDRASADNETKFESLAKEFPGRVRFYPAELSDLAGIQPWFHQIEADFGEIHGLLNNAAMKTENFFTPLLEFPIADWQAVMRVNTDAAFFVAQAVADHMVRKQIAGSIVNVLSIYGLVGPHESIYEGSEYMGQAINTPPIYAASKGAMLALTKYLAACLGKHAIRVNALTPGGVASGQNSVFSEKYSAQTPMGRQAKPHEMVGASVYLLSDASTYVNGHNLVIDGGWTAW